MSGQFKDHDWLITDTTDPSRGRAQRKCRRCGISWSPRYFPATKLPKCFIPRPAGDEKREGEG